MPATYAHYRFGLEVLAALPNASHKSMITKNRVNYDLFMIGLHGPDILFFNQPFKKNRIKQTGYKIHSRHASDFFNHALDVVQSFKKKRDYEAAYSYLCGVVCHFSLDHNCHPYIYQLTDTKRFMHSEIESEFDRLLLLEDDYEPYGMDLATHIHNSPYKAWIVSKFYDCAPPRAMYTVLQSFVFYNKLLCSHGFVRVLADLILILSGNQYTRKMMISKCQNHKLDDPVITIHQMYLNAIPVASQLITDLSHNLRGNKPLDDIYKHSFGRD